MVLVWRLSHRVEKMQWNILVSDGGKIIKGLIPKLILMCVHTGTLKL